MTAREIAPQMATPWPMPLAVRQLRLDEFRSYADLRIEIDAAPVVLTGRNGAGKTNLLEALSFLSPGRGLRQAKLGEVARWQGSGVWAVSARIETPDGLCEIATGLVPGEGNEGRERRVVKIDGVVSGAVDLAAVSGMLWLTPAMDRLFIEGPSGRRRFLDRLVFGLDPEHARRVNAYEKAMRERSRLLREGRIDPAWLGTIEERMAKTGTAVAVARRAVAERLSAASAVGGGPFPKAEIGIAGLLEEWLDAMPEAQVNACFRARLGETRTRDAEAGGAFDGPHRSDLFARHWASGALAEQCSTGEQKALLVSIVLANARLQAAERGAVPILLLDEIAAHLDADRRAALFDLVIELGAQAWITGTDPDLFAGLRHRGRFYAIDEGRIGNAVAA